MTDVISRNDRFIASLGVEAYRVGGSVRDEILGRTAKDTDYVARGVSLDQLGDRLRQASMEGSAFIPRKLIDRRGRHLGWRVRDIEIVLPRTEVSTGPGRSDFDIIVDPNLALILDASRRDFTFNALYKLVALGPPGLPLPAGAMVGSVVDPLGTGLEDLQHKIVRITHPDSFRDDPLRILRALRFVSVLGYDIEPQTLAMMHLHAEALDGLTVNGHVSGTVFEELSKILMGSDAVKALRLARDTGVLAGVLPELEPMIGFDQESKWHDLTVDEHTFTALDAATKVDAELAVRWSLLFHDSGKPGSAWRGKDGKLHFYGGKAIREGSREEVVDPDPLHAHFWSVDHAKVGVAVWRKAAERINVPAKLRERVATLIENHMLPLESPKRNKVRQMRVRHGDEVLRQLILHRACDCSGKDKKDATWKKNMDALAKIRDLQEQAIKEGIPSTPQQLKITGHDLIALGFQGGFIGNAQKKLLNDVICGQVKNDREALIERARKW